MTKTRKENGEDNIPFAPTRILFCVLFFKNRLTRPQGNCRITDCQHRVSIATSPYASFDARVHRDEGDEYGYGYEQEHTCSPALALCDC